MMGALLLCVHAAWWAHSGSWGVAQLGASAAAVGAFLVSWHDWRRAPEGQIRWDGQTWAWSGSSGVTQAAVPVVTVDFQFLMLLRLDRRPEGRCWCWVGRAQDPGSWLALRRALFAGDRAGAGGESAPVGVPVPFIG